MGPLRPRKDGSDGKKVRDRYDPSGEHIPHDPGAGNHNTGEKVQFKVIRCVHSLRNC
jgi:hypothetical protein